MNFRFIPLPSETRQRLTLAAVFVSVLEVGNVMPFGKIRGFFNSPKSKHFERAISKSIPLSSGCSITIDNEFGDVTIDTWDKDTVLIEATVTSNDRTHSDRVELISNDSEKNLVVRVYAPVEQNGNKTKMRVNLKLLIPKFSSAVNVMTDEGGIKVKNCSFNLDAKIKKGNISVLNCSGDVGADVGSGNINIECISNPTPPKLEPLNPLDIEGKLPTRPAHHSIRTTCVSGNIDISDCYEASVTSICSSGTIDVCPSKIGGSDSIRLESNEGNIGLCIPYGTKAELSAHSERGEITSGVEVVLKPVKMRINRQSIARLSKNIEGEIGDCEGESASLRMTTATGDIYIEPRQ